MQQPLLIYVESILLFSLNRGGLSTDRHAKPLRLDDVEGVGPGDRELVHILHHQCQQLVLPRLRFDTDCVAGYREHKLAFETAMQDVKRCFGLTLPTDPDAAAAILSPQAGSYP